MSWTETDDALLKELLAQGLSASKIGKQIGRTRNAVCGRAHRLKLAGVALVRKPKEPKPKPQPKKKSTPGPSSLWMSVFDLEKNDCRFPVDNRFCCKPKRDGSSYCEEHYKLAYYVRK